MVDDEWEWLNLIQESIHNWIADEPEENDCG